MEHSCIRMRSDRERGENIERILPSGPALGMDSDSAITLASFNVRCPGDEPPHDWESRVPRICEVIRRTGMDLAGLQEAVDFQLERIVLNSGFSFIGVGRNDFRKSGEHCCILYRTERFQVLESGTFGLSENPEQPGLCSWNTICPRIATWGIFKDCRTGNKFLFYNTHLDNRSEPARINGIRLILDHAGKRCRSGLPVILTGDFNAPPGSPVWKTAAEKLRDSATVSETGHRGPQGSFHKYGQRMERSAIDYIFVSSGIRVMEHWTEDNRVSGAYSSDHDPVIIRLIPEFSMH